MARPKKLAPDAEGGGYYRNLLFQLDPITGEQRLRSSQPREIVNEVKVPALLAGWKEQVIECFNGKLSENEIAYLEHLIGNYVRERVVRTNPITWNGLLERLQRISAASKALLDELNDWSLGYNTVWTRVGDASERMEDVRLTHDDVYPVVSKLYCAAHLALFEAQLQKENGGGSAHKGPWLSLIYGLADLAEFKGMKTTAAKSANSRSKKANAKGTVPYAKASPFVNLVSSVVTYAVPKLLREHWASASSGAMQDAISSVLSARKKNNAAITAGAFQKILAELNPAPPT